ncbi:MAG TPA: cytochrome-c oxidase, cbb3-type subunit II, partial [Bacteroidia bacterium]|nr:cytochrome-c oxidase, cbb3-type subunit II [Bacteroidia bacterium]
YKLRVVGGTLYIIGSFVMVYNLVKTMGAGSFVANEDAEAPALEKVAPEDKGHWHRWIERRPVQMLLLSLVMILIGGLVEIIPMLTIKSNIPTIASVKPYTPLELEGRDIYIREGCYTCHSQMIRPFRSETERYGEYSKSGEFVYDHPFQWGSKRTGPDLAREGGRYPNSWHFNHFMDPSTMSPGSIMPSYMFLIENDLSTANTAAKIKTMQSLGVPYPEGYADQAGADLKKQSDMIAADLKKNGIEVDPGKEVIALIAYMQRLGKDIKASETASR